jgi:hypothetical protein
MLKRCFSSHLLSQSALSVRGIRTLHPARQHPQTLTVKAQRDLNTMMTKKKEPFRLYLPKPLPLMQQVNQKHQSQPARAMNPCKHVSKHREAGRCGVPPWPELRARPPTSTSAKSVSLALADFYELPRRWPGLAHGLAVFGSRLTGGMWPCPEGIKGARGPSFHCHDNFTSFTQLET